MQITQRCSRCDQDRNQDSFHPDKWGKPGTYCRPCTVEYKREWRKSRGIKPQRRFREPEPPKPPRPLSSSYCAVHVRVRKSRGTATTHPCAHCTSQAEEWAYDHTDPTPVVGTTPRGRVVEYSMDMTRYLPLCKPCHAHFDVKRPAL